MFTIYLLMRFSCLIPGTSVHPHEACHILSFGAEDRHISLLKNIVEKKERSATFSNEAVVNCYFLVTTSVLILNRSIDGYF